MRLTVSHLVLAETFLSRPSDSFYGYELAQETGVDAGTLYATLYRWERAELLTSALEDIDPVAERRPPRRYYRLTGEGVRACHEIRAKSAERHPSLAWRPDLGTA